MTDYDRIASAIEFIVNKADRQPSLKEIADHLHLSEFHFQRLFSRWAGVTPKRFLQVLTVERAKQLLAQSAPLLEVSDTLGLSSGSRLYDHFIHLEAVTPGQFKTQGKGLRIEYAVQDTPFGQAFIAITPKGICQLDFMDDSVIEDHLSTLQNKWPRALLLENHQSTSAIIHRLFDHPLNTENQKPISLYVSGTNFQVQVWKALLQLAPAKVSSYSQLANAIGRPKSARAVGQAVGANPVAFLIPCHRVIQQSGKLGGYHWGETRKHAIHAWETAREEVPNEG
jgi:O-6-methylguanine DNA methyltransferase